VKQNTVVADSHAAIEVKNHHLSDLPLIDIQVAHGGYHSLSVGTIFG
jgi:hypothetical protein